MSVMRSQSLAIDTAGSLWEKPMMYVEHAMLSSLQQAEHRALAGGAGQHNVTLNSLETWEP